jgi:hypothetical protein
MKKLLLAAVALLMVTSAAHAQSWPMQGIPSPNVIPDCWGTYSTDPLDKAFRQFGRDLGGAFVPETEQEIQFFDCNGVCVDIQINPTEEGEGTVTLGQKTYTIREHYTEGYGDQVLWFGPYVMITDTPAKARPGAVLIDYDNNRAVRICLRYWKEELR